MKKFTIRLIGGTRIAIWANNLKEAAQKADEDHPHQVTGVEDNSSLNPLIEAIEKAGEPKGIAKEGEQVISWNTDLLFRFEIRYDNAVAASHASFLFDGHEFNTKYARYLIEFLKQKLLPQDYGKN